MTIRTETTLEDPTSMVAQPTEKAATPSILADLESCFPDVRSSPGEENGKTSLTLLELLAPLPQGYKTSSTLLELLAPLPQGLTTVLDDECQSPSSSFVISTNDCEKNIMKMQYLMDVYQLLSLRQLHCVATYTKTTKTGVCWGVGKYTYSCDAVKYTYSCAHKDCSGFYTMTRSTIGPLTKKDTILVADDNEDPSIPFKHTCTPHCRWGSIGCSSEFKPQGFVMSPALRFAIVAKFLYCKENHDDAYLTNLLYKVYLLYNSSKGEDGGKVSTNESESMRRRFNQELGLDITQQQWNLTLLTIFLILRPGKVDRRDIDKLACYDFWRIGTGSKRMLSPYFFHVKIRDEDPTSTRILKRVWLWTLFPVLVLLQFSVMFVFMVVLLFFYCVYPLFFFVWFILYGCWRSGAMRRSRMARYTEEGVEVTGYVSDRCQVKAKNAKGENHTDYYVTITYVLDDGTMVKKKLSERFAGDYGDSITMIVLPNQPTSGVPKREVTSN